MSEQESRSKKIIVQTGKGYGIVYNRPATEEDLQKHRAELKQEKQKQRRSFLELCGAFYEAVTSSKSNPPQTEQDIKKPGSYKIDGKTVFYSGEPTGITNKSWWPTWKDEREK